MDKKAVFFSMDALIALIIVFLTLAVALPLIKYSSHESFIHGDIINSLSSIKIGEIDNAVIKGMVAEGKITNLNKSVLEQIGEFYVTNITLAKEIGDSILSELSPEENIGIWYNNQLISSLNSSPIENAKNIELDRQIISGLKEGESVTGYSARAYLSSDVNEKYFYFGGYTGDGNISVIIDYIGALEDIDIEIAINNDFDIYINDLFSGHYEQSSSEFTPAKYDLGAYSVNFNSGENILKFTGNNLYIAGGYIKITYKNSVQYEQSDKYFFPGIKGAINLYDGFYVPGQLNKMNIFLHLNNSHELFLTIGNTSVFNDSTLGEETISIEDSELSSLLDYNSLSYKTTPIRLGLQNASYVLETLNADVFSVTDISGSMCGFCSGANFWCCLFSRGCDNNEPGCESCGGSCQDMISDAKEANKIFIDSVLNISGNRVGLSAYSMEASDMNYHELSDNDVSLKNEIDSWEATGTTCICCGINKAVNGLLADSDESKFKSLVVMSDGEANVRCAEQGTGNAKQDAIQAACTAYNDYGIRVYSVGFGDSADEITLQAIADCGNGTYYYSDISELSEIYQIVAEDIIQASYNEQTVEIFGDFFSKIYPDSYIEFNYTKEQIPYGLIITSEKKFEDNYHGKFYIPPSSQILEAKAISYSGPRWTSEVGLNNNSIYNLSGYGQDYIQLGDPYVINLPNFLIEQNNTVRITTGVSPDNSTFGSENNKIIYSILKNISVYSQISPSAGGCNWIIQFEDDSNLSLTVPDYYLEAENCYYLENQKEYNENDAVQRAVYNLLEELDFDGNGKVNTKINEDDLKIESEKITGIPYTWTTEVQVRRWD